MAPYTPESGNLVFMTIQTKFSIGDTIFFLDGHSIFHGKIDEINIHIDPEHMHVEYFIGNSGVDDDQAFESEDAIRSHLTNLPLEEFIPLPF